MCADCVSKAAKAGKCGVKESERQQECERNSQGAALPAPSKTKVIIDKYCLFAVIKYSDVLALTAKQAKPIEVIIIDPCKCYVAVEQILGGRSAADRRRNLTYD